MTPPCRPAASVVLGGRVRLLVNLAGGGLWLTGAAWLWLHYFVVTPGEFGPEHSPLEPWGLKAHGAFAFLALWTGGFLWARHVGAAWASGRRRWSGSVLLGALLLLILTGYLLYYVGDDHARELVSVVHWGLGLSGPALYLAHRLRRSLRAMAS